MKPYPEYLQLDVDNVRAQMNLRDWTISLHGLTPDTFAKLPGEPVITVSGTQFKQYGAVTFFLDYHAN